MGRKPGNWMWERLLGECICSPFLCRCGFLESMPKGNQDRKRLWWERERKSKQTAEREEELLAPIRSFVCSFIHSSNFFTLEKVRKREYKELLNCGSPRENTFHGEMRDEWRDVRVNLAPSERRVYDRPGISALLGFGLDTITLAIPLPLIFPSLASKVGWEKEARIPWCKSKIVMISLAPFFLPWNYH